MKEWGDVVSLSRLQVTGELKDGRWTYHWEQPAIDPAEAFFAHDAACPVYQSAEAWIGTLRIVNELRPVAPQLQLSNLWRSRGMREGTGKHT